MRPCARGRGGALARLSTHARRDQSDPTNSKTRPSHSRIHFITGTAVVCILDMIDKCIYAGTLVDNDNDNDNDDDDDDENKLKLPQT